MVMAGVNTSQLMRDVCIGYWHTHICLIYMKFYLKLPIIIL